MYFVPELRAALLAVAPDPGEEFSVLDEAALLFRMLLAGGPGACQVWPASLQVVEQGRSR